MAFSNETLKAKVKELADSLPHLDAATRLFAARELSAVIGLLWEDEKVEHAVQGTYDGRQGMLFATNSRLLMVDKGLIRLKTEDFGYSNITSIECQTGLLFGTITIYASGNRTEIKQCQKAPAHAFAEFVRAKISKLKSDTPHAPAAAKPSNIDEIERLVRLRDSGALTEDEFAKAKANLLG